MRKQDRQHPFRRCAAGFLLLLLLAEGICAVLVSAISLQINTIILYPAIALLCAAAVLFFDTEKLDGYRLYAGMAGGILYAVLLLFSGSIFRGGAKQFLNAVLQSVNQKYAAGLTFFSGTGEEAWLTVFLVELFIPLVFLLGTICIYRADMIKLLLLCFPSGVLLFLVGNTPSALSLYLFFSGVLGLFAASRVVYKRKVRGKSRSSRFRNNLENAREIQCKQILLTLIVGTVVSVPAFWIIRPFLHVEFDGAKQVVRKAEGELFGFFSDILPGKITGEWNMRAEMTGSGVMDGMLENADGYVYTGMEDLKVTISQKPEEPVYLKGYVGSVYADNCWKQPSEKSFTDACVNWKTEGNPELYIQNLPFLRNSYAAQDRGETLELQQISVEKINANSRYTYYPYYSFLNDYYEVEGGDGFVAGQNAQEDIFFCFPEEAYQKSIRLWNEDETKKSVLDRIEQSYAVYTTGYYLYVPEGYADLEEMCTEQDIKEGEVEKAEEYIRKYLSEEYRYAMNTPDLPEGADFLRYFLEESKTGCSTHFASAGTLLFRMFGIPARYVVGYAAPASLFTAAEDGRYTAVLCDDNAQAWTEIYIRGEGWTPIDLTPGAVGMTGDVMYQSEEETEDVNLTEDAAEIEQGRAEKPQDKKTDSFHALREEWKQGSLTAVIGGIGLVLLMTVLLIGNIWVVKRYRRNLGLDRHRSCQERIVDIFRAYYRLLLKRGMPKDVESTSEQFLKEALRQNPALAVEEFEKMMQIVLESSYGCGQRTEEEVLFMRQMYLKMRKRK